VPKWQASRAAVCRPQRLPPIVSNSLEPFTIAQGMGLAHPPAMSARASILAAATFLVIPGCVVTPRTVYQVGPVATGAVFAAAVFGGLAVMSHHDAHQHGDQCGHYRRWHHDHWIYFYDGHWEYYDEGTASWYFYAEA
jgi:hypothetical protein